MANPIEEIKNGSKKKTDVKKEKVFFGKTGSRAAGYFYSKEKPLLKIPLLLFIIYILEIEKRK